MPSSITPQELDTLWDYPALQPPAGVSPNFIDPKNQNQPLFIVSSLLLGIMAIFIVNRAYAKSFIKQKYSWDDLTIMLAVVGSVAYYAACIWGAQKGKMGTHQWDISLRETSSPNLTIPSYLIAVLTPPTMLFTKVTFFLMYLNIFQPMRWMRICAQIGAGLTSLFYLGMFLAQVIIQTPRHGETLFSRLQTTNARQDSLALSVPQSVVGLVVDLYILLLPVIAVSRLQLPRRRKIGISLIFMTGIMACVSSLLSIYYRNTLNHSPDLTWVLMSVNTVTLVEMFVGIICACMPSAAQTCRHLLPHYKSLKTRVYFRFHTLRSRIRRSQYSNQLDLRNKPGSTSTAGPYLDLQSYKLAKHSDLTQTKGIRTFIQGGPRDDIESDGIQLTYDMRTNSQHGCANTMV